MTQRGRVTTLQQRLEMWERAQAGETDPQIAAGMHLSRGTVRKWRRRTQREGRAGLVSRVGRPKTGALGTASAELRTAVRALRETHPGWGPQTLRLELQADARFGTHWTCSACGPIRLSFRERLAGPAPACTRLDQSRLDGRATALGETTCSSIHPPFVPEGLSGESTVPGNERYNFVRLCAV